MRPKIKIIIIVSSALIITEFRLPFKWQPATDNLAGFGQHQTEAGLIKWELRFAIRWMTPPRMDLHYSLGTASRPTDARVKTAKHSVPNPPLIDEYL